MAKIAVSEEALPIGAVHGLRELGHSVWLIPPGDAADTKRLIKEFPPDVAVLRVDVVDHSVLAGFREERPQLEVMLVAHEPAHGPLPGHHILPENDDPVFWLRTVTAVAPSEQTLEESPAGIRQTLLRLIDQTQEAFRSLAEEGEGDEQLQEIRRRLERSYETSVRFLLGRLERDVPGFVGHSSRVADLCRRIAGGLGLSADETQAVVMAGLLRDIGLHLVAPTEALRRAGPLQPVEWEGVHSHPVASATVAAPLTGDRPTGMGILQHHERIDGTGYPDGKKGDEVPLAARIVMVADEFEAMTHPRAHRAAKTTGEATRALREEVAAGRLDGDVVDALVRTLEPAPEGDRK